MIGLELEKCSNYFTKVRLNLWYIGLGLGKHLHYLLLYTRRSFIIWIKQAEISLEKYEDFLELSIKQLVMQASPIALDQMTCGVWKTKR